MCGIAGIFDRSAAVPSSDLPRLAGAMADRLAHRGPDDAGVWADPGCGVALAQRRLAVIDLSQEGHQPMLSSDGRYVIAFNGEIYNYGDLRSALESKGARFRGHSDTEVLLASFVCWGIEESLKRSNGMFAFAVWDRQRRRLTLGRDRFGQKPLYYGWSRGHFLFGSEMKALAAHPAFVAEIDQGATLLYMRHGWIPAPYTIYRSIQKLLPGTVLHIDVASLHHESQPEPYWSAVERAHAARQDPFRGTEDDAVEALDGLLRDAVKLCMVADVPLGAFLSGGIDSSAVVSLMQAISANPVRTFTVGFHEDQYDEAAYARRVAAHLGTNHTELYLTERDALNVIPTLGSMYDEPFADSSQIPTFLISKLARRHVTVALSGDGGDEIFGGYSRYHWATTIERAARAVPGVIRRVAATGARAVPVAAWDGLAAAVAAALPQRLRYTQTGDKISKLADLIELDSSEEIYRHLVSIWPKPSDIVIGGGEPQTLLDTVSRWTELSLPQRMMLADSIMYLPDDILTKVDRASMRVSLETRIPLLDHRVFEFMWRVPSECRIAVGQGKVLLRKLLARYVPSELVDRPKMGFAVPIQRWLRGDLRTWAHDLLASSILVREGIVDSGSMWRIWDEHASGRRNWQHRLWSLLMFEMWFRANRPTQMASAAAQ